MYVKLNPDGSTKNIIVSDWLKNLDQTASLEDASDLSDIKNVKGTESFVQDSDNSLVWSSSGSLEKIYQLSGELLRGIAIEQFIGS